MRIFRNFNYFCFVFNFHLYRILQQWHWFTSVPFFIHREKKTRKINRLSCMTVLSFAKLFCINFFYLKRILNFSETSVTYNCSLFSTIFIEICPRWVLIAKLRNLLDVTKDWVISSIIREYVHLSCERFLL